MTAISTANAPTMPSPSSDPGLRAAIGAEWIKLRTSRSIKRNLVLGTVLGLALSGLLSAVSAATYDEWPAAEQAAFDPVVYPMAGSLMVLIFFTAAAVNAVATEYGSGMIRLTFTAIPRRGRVVAAKAVVVTAAVTVASTVAMVGMFLLGQVLFASGDLPTASITDGDVVRMLVLMVAQGPLYPVLAVGLAFLFRSTAPAVSTTLALIFAPAIFGGLLPGWWQRNVLALLPGPASDSLAIGHLGDSEMYLHPAAAAVVVLAWTVGMLVIAHRVVERRDA